MHVSQSRSVSYIGRRFDRRDPVTQALRVRGRWEDCSSIFNLHNFSVCTGAENLIGQANACVNACVLSSRFSESTIRRRCDIPMQFS